MEYVFPVIFFANHDQSYMITFPDFPGCISEGKALPNAIQMASSALSQWIAYLSDQKQPIPPPAHLKSISMAENEFSSLFHADSRNTRAVKRTVSIPSWMDEKASEVGLSLSRVLQDALMGRLQ